MIFNYAYMIVEQYTLLFLRSNKCEHCTRHNGALLFPLIERPDKQVVCRRKEGHAKTRRLLIVVKKLNDTFPCSQWL